MFADKKFTGIIFRLNKLKKSEIEWTELVTIGICMFSLEKKFS